MNRFSMRLLVLVLVCVAGFTVCRADERAAVTGLVTDPAGRSVPGVTVLITNLSTNVAFRTVTNDQGIYRVPSLQPGIYRITVDKDGFKSIVKSGIELHVQDVASINFELQIGSVNETVTVEAGGLVMNTTDATVSTVVDRQFAENLPLNGRSFQTLIQLAPGVVLTTSTQYDSGQFSVNGQRPSSNYWMVDGVSANIGIGPNPGNGAGGALGSFSALGGTNSLVSVDAMQEFRIQTSTYAPEFGRTPGGQISIVTRSGENSFHGTAFDYIRNTILDASNWFNGYTNDPPLAKAKEQQNDFGGTFSGPFLKDRTFFFFSYEGLRLRLPQTTLTNVPCDSTCLVFGNARAMAAPALQPYLNAYPLPNGPEIFTPCTPNVNGCPASGQQPTGSAAFNASYSNPATLDAYSLRIDHKLSYKVNLFGRYNYSPSGIDQRGNGFALSTIVNEQIVTQTATLGATWAISPVMANDFRFNYSSTRFGANRSLGNFGGAAPLLSLGFPSPFTSENSTLVFNIGSLLNGSALSVGPTAHNAQQQFNIVDDLAVQRGSHALKFGVDFRRLSPKFGPQLYSQQPFFLNIPSAEAGDPFLANILQSRGATLLFHNLGLFAQDTWRVTPRLTVTYGLRWDIDFAPSSINGPALPAVTGLNLNDLSNLALAPAGTQPFSTSYGGVAPRVGVAYQLSQSTGRETVLRGGLGTFYDLATSEVGTTLSLGFPFGASKTVFGTALGGTSTFPLDPGDAGPPPITPASLSLPGATLYALNPNLKLPYALEWNVALEQALGKEQTISASYIGSTGRQLLQSALVFAPNQNFASADLISNTGTSNYNALQIQFQRRFSHGLQALASYTWSHSIDDGSAGSYGNNSNLLIPASNPNANRGPSDFDIRNAFSAAITYDVPAPKINAFTNEILRGWSLENIIFARSAPPVDVSDSSFTEVNNAVADIRPDIVPGQPSYLYGSQCADVLVAPLVPSGQPVPPCPGGRGINPAAFTDPPFDPVSGLPLRQGNLSRNALRGFGAAQWDFAVHRDFPIHESLKLQFRAEMFNVLNHSNFGSPNSSFASPQFGGPFPGFGVASQMLGQSLQGLGGAGGGAFNPVYQIGGPRSIQFALKLIF